MLVSIGLRSKDDITSDIHGGKRRGTCICGGKGSGICIDGDKRSCTSNPPLVASLLLARRIE